MKLGLIGEKLSHSKSPEIHQRLFDLQHLEGTYSLLETQRGQLEEVLRQLQRYGYSGVNVTIPYKIDVMPFLTHISKEAVDIGAVNTIHITPDGFFGYNTDYSGFVRSLEHADITVQGRNCVVLGTGGAARAVIQSLADNGAASVTVVSRTPYSKEEFNTFLRKAGAEEINYTDLARRKSGDILINATPVGMYPHGDTSPAAESIAACYGAIVDLIYNPKETVLLQYGRKHGAVTLNGMYMLVAQAISSEEIWQGKKIPASVIEAIANEMEG